MDLRAYPQGAATADYAQRKPLCELLHDLSSPGLKKRSLLSIEPAPEPISFRPRFGWQLDGTIYVMPVGRVILRKGRRIPANPESSKHLQVCIGIGFKRIEQRSIPIEQNG